MTTFTTEDRINAMSDLNKPEMSRQDIADVLGMSRQTVTSIEESAMRKIKQALFKRGIEKEDLL
jgi:transcriptional regulator